MNKIAYLFILIALGCSSNKCWKDNELYLRFDDMFKKDENLLKVSRKEDVLTYNRELEFKNKLFSKVCRHLKGNKRIIFMEEKSPFGEQREGMIYLYETDKSIYYDNTTDPKIILIKEENGHNPYKKVLEIVKPDFYNGANKLKSYFSTKSMGDAWWLQLAYFDLTKNPNADSLVEFSCVLDAIMENKFEDEFKND